MKIKQFFNNLKIIARINMYMAGILLIILLVIIGFYKYQVYNILNKTRNQVFIDIDDIVNVCNIIENQTKNGFDIEDYNLLKPFINNKKYFETGITVLVAKSGEYLIHPHREGKVALNEEIHQKRLSFIENRGYFHYLTNQEGIQEEKYQYFHYYEPYEAFIIIDLVKDELFQELNKMRNMIIVGLIFAIFLFFIGVYLMLKPIVGAINNIGYNISEMARGKIVNKLYCRFNDEIGDITNSINILIEGLNKTARFSDEIGKGNLDAEFNPLSENDVLGNSLLEMRSSLKLAKEEEGERKIEVEKQNWATQGLAKFADILRQDNDNIDKLSFNIMSNLVSYLEANQGAIFVINDSDPKDVFFELTSAIAYDREKLMKQQFRAGESLVGRAIHEKLTIHLKETPEEYINITSGMGTANPNSLLIVPLLLNDEVFGVIELASFKELEKYQIEFIERLGENIGSTISSVRINQRTAKLLGQSQQQSEELAAQEEEMRQNLEELLATQEEADRKQKDMDSLWDAINTNNLVVVYDMEEKVTEVNSRFSEVFAMGKDRILGSRSSELGIGQWESTDEYKEFWSDLRSGMSKKRTINITTDKGEFTIAETYTPILDSEGTPAKVLNIGIVV